MEGRTIVGHILDSSPGKEKHAGGENVLVRLGSTLGIAVSELRWFWKLIGDQQKHCPALTTDRADLVQEEKSTIIHPELSKKAPKL